MNPPPTQTHPTHSFQDMWVNDALLDGAELILKVHEKQNDDLRYARSDIENVYRFYEDEEGKRQAEVVSFRTPRFDVFGAAQKLV